MRIVLLALCLVLPSVVLAEQPSSPADVPNDFVIGPEDVLAVNVWKEPELSVKEVVVRPDGKVSLPLVGDIEASGLTPKQLQDRVTEKIKEYVASPTVTVVVVKIGSQSVSIVGQVAKPGVYYLGSPMTVLELLAKAGGLREDAKTKKIVVIRQDGVQSSHYPFNYKEVSKGQNLAQNITLKNGDVVIVP